MLASMSKMSDTASISSLSMEHGYVKTIFAKGDSNDIQAFINVMRKSDRMPSQESMDKFCQGCGKYGHDVFHQGCDFCAQLSLALKCLDQNPNEVKRIIKEYMKFQCRRQSNSKEAKNKDRRQPSFSPNKCKNIKATV